MKTKCIIVAFYCLSSFLSFGQKFNYGPKAGITFNKLTGSIFKENYTASLHIGGFVTYSIGKKWDLQGELLLSQVNTDTSTFNHYDVSPIKRVEISYLYLPIMLNYKISKHFFLQFGQQTSFTMYENLVSSKTGHSSFKAIEIALGGGMAYRYKKFGLYGRYLYGLNTQNNIIEGEDWKNQSFQFGLQYYVFK